MSVSGDISDEMLAAYADGELDEAARAGIEAAAREDPRMAARIARYRALTERLRSAYAAELEEPVPDRLREALRDPESGVPPTPADLAAARGRKERRPGPRIAPRWPYSLAAGVLIAVGAGLLAWRQAHPPAIRSVGGTLVAGGALAAGLSNQLSGEDDHSAVSIGLTFRAKSGSYCRTFTRFDDAGLACRRAGRWEILALVKRSAAERITSEGGPQYRTAGSAIPAAVLAAVEQQISGEPLDRSAEVAARDRHWTDAPAR